ncbi:MAG: hypothetical protein GX682_03790 [Clostridiaceae bacterium]|nr:hypothetical protein [Clostridiaceae bacterium]
MLEGKVIYLITTGATKSKNVKNLLDDLSNEGATCIVMPTEMSCSIMDLSLLEDYRIKREYTFNHISADDRIPEEDIVIIAPCTFNTFSKIANGIADNYPLSILHEAIGKGKYIIIAPSMNQGYFNHPITKENFNKILSFGNISIIYPEYVYNDDGILEKITMAPWEKILDSVCHKYSKIRYFGKKVNYNMQKIIDLYYPEFFKTGKYIQDNQYSNGVAGFIAKRIPEGILITSTGSSLGNLSREHLTLIHTWKNHCVEWSGENMPSSETPLVLELFEAYHTSNVVVHGHCRDITYSPKMLKYTSKEYLRYGSWNELYKIKPVLDNYNYAIMKLHGEIILSDTFKNALTQYFKMYTETLK